MANSKWARYNDDREKYDPYTSENPGREAAVLFGLLHRREGETVERLLEDIRCSAGQEAYLRKNMGVSSVRQFEEMLAYRDAVEREFLRLVEREREKEIA